MSLRLRPRVSGLETRISNLAPPYLRVGVPVSLVWRSVSLTLRRLAHAWRAVSWIWIYLLPAHGLERWGGELGRAAARRFSRSEERGCGVYRSHYENLKRTVEGSPEHAGIRLYVDRRSEAAQRTYERLGMTREHYDLYEWLKP